MNESEAQNPGAIGAIAVGISGDAPQGATPRPQGSDAEAWRAYWVSLGQPWRREPEIAAARQGELAERRMHEASVTERRYPFGGMALTRADVEWLLATHDDGQGHVGPIDGREEEQRKRPGLDLRAAVLREVDLSGLPLAKMLGGLTEDESLDLARRSDGHELVEAAGMVAPGVTLRGALLQGASLRAARLDGADLRDTHMEGATLERAFGERADLRGAIFDRRSSLGNMRLEWANLSGVNLREAIIVLAMLEGATLSGADLRGAKLDGGRIREADMRGALLDGANLSGATLWGVNLTGASLRGVNFKGAQLQRAVAWSVIAQIDAALSNTLDGADLTDAQLDGANLTGASFVGARLDGASVDGAELAGASFVGASLAGASLTQARCSPTTNLKDAVMARGDAAVTIFGVHWNGADIAAARWADVGLLGDERRVRNPRDAAGARKDQAQQLAELAVAVRAYRQLTNTLQEQGQRQLSTRFAYRSEVVQRTLLWRQITQLGQREKLGPYLFSLFLGALTGYGHRMERILIAYVTIVALAAGLYYLLGLSVAPHLSWAQALLVSISAFHGRVFSEQFLAGSPQTWVSAGEAICGLVIEGVFIAMLTQRFFGK